MCSTCNAMPIVSKYGVVWWIQFCQEYIYLSLYLVFLLLLLLLLIRYHLPTLDLLSLIKTLRSYGTHTLAHHRNKNPFCTFCFLSVLCVCVCLFSLAAVCRSVVKLRIVTHIVLLYFRFKCVTESATFALVVACSYHGVIMQWQKNGSEKKNTITMHCDLNEVLFSCMAGS